MSNAQLPTANSGQRRPSYAAARHTSVLDANSRGLVPRRQQDGAKGPEHLAELAQRVHDLAIEVARLPKVKPAREQSHKRQPVNLWVIHKITERKRM